MKKEAVQGSSSLFTFQVNYEHPTLCYATVVAQKTLINCLIDETARSIQHNIQAHGFQQGSVPIEYITTQYRTNIIEHLKEFLLKFGVMNFLFDEIIKHKILVAGEPRLHNIEVQQDNDARFIFELSIFPQITVQDWKYFPFKAPKRKNYKDLDRQVELFLQEEKKFQTITDVGKGISFGDWINFDITLIDQNNKPLIKNFTQNFWLKFGDDEVETPLRELFWQKKKNDEFITNNQGLQDYFSDQLRTNFNFKITIVEVVSNSYFCVDHFKQHFRIKTQKDVHKKLIEVFSYRNDISQRRTTVEDSFKLLLSKHAFSAPQHLVLRQQKNILHAIQKNPDYNVYRKQNDFQLRIQQLAEKQVKETLFIDQLAYNENINTTRQDFISYLNLEKRPRTKEFIYFHLPETKIDGQEMPLSMQEISRICTREKTINHVIHLLTKK